MVSDESANTIIDGLTVDPTDPTIFTSSTGVKLKLKRFNRIVLVDAERRLPVPKVPEIWREDRKVYEDNPNHPDYIKAMTLYNRDLNNLAIDIAIIMGVEVKFIPPEMQEIEDVEWAQQIEDAVPGMEIPASGNRRKLAWVKYYAIPDEVELTDLSIIAMTFDGGVVSQEVLKAADSFRDTTNGIATVGVEPTQDVKSRNNNDSPKPRPRARVRS